MDSWKLLGLALAILLVAGSAVAYTAGGDTDPDDVSTPTECTDDVDNDGDGKVDGKDSGCVKPYSEDDSEANLWDMDASWTFSGNTAPSDAGPSVFHGSEAYNSGTESLKADAEAGSGDSDIREYYVENAGSYDSGNWGGGTIEFQTPSITDAGETDSINSGMWELIDTPWDTGGSGQCGDTVRDDSGGNTGCPEDYGMPDDAGTTVDTSDSTISDELGSIDGESVVPIFSNQNNAQLYAEPNSPGYDAGWDSTDYTTENGGNRETIDPEDTACAGQPDFFIESGNKDVIKRVDCRPGDGSTETQSVGGFTTSKYDYDTPEDESYTTYDTSNSMSVCTGGESGTDASCTGSTTKCWGRTKEKNIYEKQTTETSYERTVTTYAYLTERTSSGDYKVVSTDPPSNDWTLTLYHDVKDGDTKIGEKHSCDSSSKPTGCTESGNCTYTSETYWTSSTYSYAKDWERNKADIIIERIDDGPWDEAQIFDTNDAETGKNAKSVLFNGDYSTGNINHLSVSGRGYYSVDQTDDGRNQGNDEPVSLSRFKVDFAESCVSTGPGVSDCDASFISKRDYFETYDADGANGQADGYIAIKDDSDGKRIVGSTPSTFLDQEISKGKVSASFVSQSDVPIPDCPGDYINCVASVDVSMKDLNSWSSTAPSSGIKWEFVSGNPYSTSASLGVCKLYRKLSGDETMSCTYTPPPGGDGANDGTGGSVNPGEPCGDEPNEWWAYMEGPEVNDDRMDKFRGHQQYCIDQESDCVLHGNDVNEGTVANVEYNSTTRYEVGGSSPDWEVCLAIPGEGDTHDGDNNFPDDGDSNDDIGGEWYDLDSDIVNDYLRGTSLTSGDSNDDGVVNATDVSYYWRENDNPYHADYNPRGGDTTGLALEDDCGPSVTGCDDESSNVDSKDPYFYSFFTQLKRDEDYDPQGEQEAGDGAISVAMYRGYVNKLEEDTDQLEPGMATEATWDLSTVGIWSDSVGGTEEADMWVISGGPEDLVSNRGRVFDPGNVYHHKDYTGFTRSKPSDGPVAKDDRVFGNSFADIPTEEIDTDGDGSTEIYPGNGTWIDPDYIKEGWDSGEYRSSMFTAWDDKLTYKMDISGFDSGLGFDLGGTGFSFQDPGRRYIVKGDIYFEGENDGEDNDGDGSTDEGPGAESWEGTDLVGETSPHLEPPMCGDDQREYLVEEIGESSNPIKLDGAYACVDTRDVCVDLDSNPRVVESGSYKEVGEPDENFGRFKEDEELCARADDNPDDDLYKWYDQDFGDIDGDGNQETCRDNTLYGSDGVRWISSSYIRDYPFAVRKGIDDDWNAHLERLWEKGEFTGNVTSKPGQTSWNFDQESPVPTGSPNETIATLGFCGGDDGDEQIVTQRCRAQACDTDTSVIGVVEANQKSSCILDQAKYPQVSGDKRQIYQPGESVTFDYGTSTREASCFDGVWYDKWPVVFQQDRIDVGKGETRTLQFSVINIRPEPRKYRVELVDTEVSQFAEFGSRDGDSFVVEVPAQSSKSFSIEVFGGDTSIGSDTDYADLRVQATAIDGDISGEDRAGINIKETVQTGGGERNTGTRNVPGVGFIHLLVLSLLSTLLFFSQS